MYLRGNSLGLSTPRHEDYPLAAAVGLVVAAYLGFFVGLFWLMQPTVTANPGLAAYQPPPKTIVRYADSPWVPPPHRMCCRYVKPPNRRPRSQRAALPRSRRKRQRSKRRGQVLAGRVPSESSNQIRSGATLRPGHTVPVLAPGSDPLGPRLLEGRHITSACGGAWGKSCPCRSEAIRQLARRNVANVPHFGAMWIALTENHAAAGTDQAPRC